METPWHHPFSKVELSERLGVRPETITHWGYNPPRYAIAYIELYCELEELRETVKEFGESI